MEHKSEKMLKFADENGWKTQIKPTIPESKKYDEIVWDLFCVRGQETLHVRWVGDRQVEAVYTLGGYTQKPARAGAVQKLMAGKPDPKKLDQDETALLLEDRSVPWVHDTPAVEILLAVMHKQIHWIRKMDGVVCDAVVDVNTHSAASMKYFRVYTSPRDSENRVLEWADGLGFHTVALDQIVQVD